MSLLKIIAFLSLLTIALTPVVVADNLEETVAIEDDNIEEEDDDENPDHQPEDSTEEEEDVEED